MSFGRFMIFGQDKNSKRANHPADTVEAKTSSFDYSGIVSDRFFVDGKKYIVIDRAVHLGIALPYRRLDIQSELNSHALKANVTAVGGVAGIGYSAYRFAMGDYLAGGVGALSCMGLTGWALKRAGQANRASKEWNEPVAEVCETRKLAANSFRELMKKPKGSYFTSEETQHVFHRTMVRASTNLEQQMMSGSPEQIEKSVFQFAEENPIHAHGLEYAFGNLQTVRNPVEPKASWKRSDLNKLAEKSFLFSTKAALFKAGTEQKLSSVSDMNLLGQTAIDSTQRIAQASEAFTFGARALTSVVCLAKEHEIKTKAREEFLKTFPNEAGEIVGQYRSMRRS